MWVLGLNMVPLARLQRTLPIELSPQPSPPNCAFKVVVMGGKTKLIPVLFCPIIGCWYFHFSFSQKRHHQALELWVQVDGDLVLTLLALALWPQTLSSGDWDSVFSNSEPDCQYPHCRGAFEDWAELYVESPWKLVANDWAQIWFLEKGTLSVEYTPWTHEQNALGRPACYPVCSAIL